MDGVRFFYSDVAAGRKGQLVKGGKARKGLVAKRYTFSCAWHQSLPLYTVYRVYLCVAFLALPPRQSGQSQMLCMVHIAAANANLSMSCNAQQVQVRAALLTSNMRLPGL